MMNKMFAKMKKMMAITLTALTIASCVGGTNVQAADSQTTIHFFQGKTSNCVLDSNVFMLRKLALKDGHEDWNLIKESDVKKVACSGKLTKNVYTYKNKDAGLEMSTATKMLYSMKSNNYKTNSNVASVKTKLKKELDNHPEGIVAYIFNNNAKGSTKWQHAVLLTDYEGDQFTCLDPGVKSHDEINLTKSVLANPKHANTTSIDSLLKYSVKIWYVKTDKNTVITPAAKEAVLMEEDLGHIDGYLPVVSPTCDDFYYRDTLLSYISVGEIPYNLICDQESAMFTATSDTMVVTTWFMKKNTVGAVWTEKNRTVNVYLMEVIGTEESGYEEVVSDYYCGNIDNIDGGLEFNVTPGQKYRLVFEPETDCIEEDTCVTGVAHVYPVAY